MGLDPLIENEVHSVMSHLLSADVNHLWGNDFFVVGKCVGLHCEVLHNFILRHGAVWSEDSWQPVGDNPFGKGAGEHD